MNHKKKSEQMSLLNLAYFSFNFPNQMFARFKLSFSAASIENSAVNKFLNKK
jgi:hypothetical protein